MEIRFVGLPAILVLKCHLLTTLLVFSACGPNSNAPTSTKPQFGDNNASESRRTTVNQIDEPRHVSNSEDNQPEPNAEEHDEYAVWIDERGLEYPHGDAVKRIGNRVAISGEFAFGRRIGEWRYYNDNGDVVSLETWEDGTLVDWSGEPVTSYGGFGYVAVSSVVEYTSPDGDELVLDIFYHPVLERAYVPISMKDRIAIRSDVIRALETVWGSRNSGKVDNTGGHSLSKLLTKAVDRQEVLKVLVHME